MNHDGTGLLTIGALARATGLSVRTIRYWSDEGALPPVARSAGGYRTVRTLLYVATGSTTPAPSPGWNLSARCANWASASTTYAGCSPARPRSPRSLPRT